MSVAVVTGGIALDGDVSSGRGSYGGHRKTAESVPKGPSMISIVLSVVYREVLSHVGFW